jgi:hypothetical protein
MIGGGGMYGGGALWEGRSAAIDDPAVSAKAKAA